MFRIPEKRPPKAVSTAFTALVFLPLAIMLIVVSIAWRYVWAKFVRAFPMSTKLWKIRSAVWVWQWPCGLGTGPPRERVQGSLVSRFLNTSMIEKPCFFFCINLVTFVVSLWVLISVKLTTLERCDIKHLISTETSLILWDFLTNQEMIFTQYLQSPR